MKQNTLKLSLFSIGIFFGFQSQTMEITKSKPKSSLRQKVMKFTGHKPKQKPEPTSLNHMPYETTGKIATMGLGRADISNLALTSTQCYAALEQPSFIKWSAIQFPGMYRKTVSSRKYRQVNNDILKLCANSKNGYDRALYEKRSQDLFFDPNRIGKIGPHRSGSPVTAASYSSNPELVESLLKKRANPNLISGPNADTPIAATLRANFGEEVNPDLSTKQQNIIRRLVEGNANINHVTAAKRTYIDIALDNNSGDHIPTLINYGIDPNHQNGYNRETPLNKIIKQQNPEKAEMNVVALLKKGANPFLRNDNGDNAFVCCRNNPKLTKLIKDNSKDESWYATQTKEFFNT
jgi:hypothetical protein